MKLPQSPRLTYRFLSRSDEDRRLLEILDTNPINREFFPGGALEEHQIPGMIERFVGGYENEKHKTPFFMVFNDEGSFIGRAGFDYMEELKAIKISYIIDHNYWGKGYATEMIKTLLNWAKDNSDYNEIFAVTGVDHLASIAIMKKVGMKYVDNRILKGIDCVLYKKSL